METKQQGSKPDGLFHAATQAGGGDPGLRPLERHLSKPPHRKREVTVLQLATRRVRRDTLLAGRIHCNRGQLTCCADERPAEGHDREEHPRRLRR